MKIVEDKDDLWSALLRGEKAAFEEIYRTYAQELINYGYRITSNREVIKDCVQDLFVNLWSTKENLGTTTSIRFYLFRSLRNRLIRQLQREEGRNVFMTDDDLEEEVHFKIMENSEEYYQIDKYEFALKSAIERLPERQREIIQLRFYHDFEIEEIMEIMDISNQSVRNTLYKAVERLRAVLISQRK